MLAPWYRIVVGPVSISGGDPDAGAFSGAGEQQVAAGFTGRRASIRFSRLEAANLPGDAAMISLDMLNFTAGVVDNTWTDADFAAAEAAIGTWWNAIKSYWTVSCRLDQVRWYRFGPTISPPQPAVRVVEFDSPGTSAAETLPSQIAISVTERTPIRKRWGRMYLPAPSDTTSDGDGRIVQSVGAALATATATLYDSLETAGLRPVVYSPTVERAYGVTGIVIDDIFDVIRSRRHKVTLRRDYRGL